MTNLRTFGECRGPFCMFCLGRLIGTLGLMKTAGVALVVVVLVALGVLFGDVLRHPVYTPDGLVYARYAARDGGAPDRDATLRARAFYEKTPLMSVPRYRELIELAPSVAFEKSRIFGNRVLYPWVVSLLLPAVGFRALFVVSAVSYVLFGAALFWMLTAFGRPWIAAAISIVALLLPLTRQLAASDLTDMFAAVWWTVSLGALLRLLRAPQRSMLIVLAVASVLLVLTRPTPYLVVLPAIALGVVRGAWLPLAASMAGVVAFAAVAAATHAFGAAEQLRWVYSHEPSPVAGGITAWYKGALLSTVRFTLSEAVRTVVPAALVALLLYAWGRLRLRDEMAVLAVAGLACLLAIFFNPVPSSIPRVVAFPLIPVFCAIAQAAAQAVSVRSAAQQIAA